MVKHINPKVRKIVTEHARDIESLEVWGDNGGARLVCRKINYTGVRRLAEEGYIAGGMESEENNMIKIYIVK